MFIFQKNNIYMLSLCKNLNSIKSINKTNQTYRKYISLEKKVEAKHYLRGQIWDQANFWYQAKNLFGANQEAKIGTRPTLRSGQARPMGPGQVL